MIHPAPNSCQAFMSKSAGHGPPLLHLRSMQCNSVPVWWWELCTSVIHNTETIKKQGWKISRHNTAGLWQGQLAPDYSQFYLMHYLKPLSNREPAVSLIAYWLNVLPQLVTQTTRSISQTALTSPSTPGTPKPAWAGSREPMFRQESGPCRRVLSKISITISQFANRPKRYRDKRLHW